MMIKSQKGILHVLDEHLSIINTTNSKIVYNSNQLRHLTLTVQNFNTNFQTLVSNFNKTQTIFNRHILIQHCMRSFSYLSEYVSYTVNYVNTFIHDVEISLSDEDSETETENLNYSFGEEI